jgi:transcriptional regulator with XRE-family HTH domain
LNISLKAARVNKDLTQKEAAKAIGVSVDTLANWERGKTYPNITRMDDIERAYGVSYNDIIFLPRITVKR